MPRLREQGMPWRDPVKVPPRLAIGSVVNNHRVLEVVYIELFTRSRFDKYRVRSLCCGNEIVHSEKRLTNSTYEAYAKLGGCPKCSRGQVLTPEVLYKRSKKEAAEAQVTSYTTLAFSFISAPVPPSVLAVPFQWR